MQKQRGKWSDPIQELHCNSCRRATLHRLLKNAVSEGSDVWEAEGYQDYDVTWETRFSMFECCGCKEVVLRRIYLNSDIGGPEISYYPPPISRHPPNWRHKLPIKLRNVLEEIYRASDANCSALSMMGARTLVDLLMLEAVGDVGNFIQKLDDLEKKGVISSQNKKVIATALEAGNAAAHRGFAPKTSDVHAVMDIVENILQSVYVFDDVAANLRKITPRRRKKKGLSKLTP